MCDCKNYFVCVIAKTVGYFVIAKKRTELVCLQLFFVRDCNQKSYLWLQNLTVSVWLELLGYLVNDCKPE
jgi:hypothetical protein